MESSIVVASKEEDHAKPPKQGKKDLNNQVFEYSSRERAHISDLTTHDASVPMRKFCPNLYQKMPIFFLSMSSNI
jgi:hypothetical protein